MKQPPDTLPLRLDARAEHIWLLAGSALLLVVLLPALRLHTNTQSAALVLAGLMVVLAGAMYMSGHRLRLHPAERRVWYRRSRWPGAPVVAGSFESCLRGLQVGPKPCGRRRHCIAEYAVWLLFQGEEPPVQLSGWGSPASAEAEAREMAVAWRLPLYEVDGACIYQPEAE